MSHIATLRSVLIGVGNVDIVIGTMIKPSQLYKIEGRQVSSTESGSRVEATTYGNREHHALKALVKHDRHRLPESLGPGHLVQNENKICLYATIEKSS